MSQRFTTFLRPLALILAACPLDGDLSPLWTSDAGGGIAQQIFDVWTEIRRQRLVPGGRLVVIIDAAPFYAALVTIIRSNQLSPSEQIPKLRLVLERLLQELTRDEPQDFANLFARCVFVVERHRVPDQLASQIHGFRKYANRVVHGEVVPSDRDWQISLKAVCETIAFFSHQPVPMELMSVYADLTQARFAFAYEKPRETVPVITAVVLDVGKPQTVSLDRGRSRKSCLLQCESDELGKITISCQDSCSHIGELAEPYSLVRVFDLTKAPGHDALYNTTLESLVVLEPDILVDATEIAECFQRDSVNYLIPLLAQFFPATASFSMALGNIVNQLLDDCLTRDETKFEESFSAAIHQLPLLGAMFDRAQMEALRSSALEHYTVISRHVRRLRPDTALGTVMVEPTFLSETYGLQGRLDAMLSYGDPVEHDIVELKSGTPPSGGYWITTSQGRMATGVWRNHLAQVTAYKLLLSSTFPGRRGTSMVLYSKDGHRPLRNVPDANQVCQELLETRNSIVAAERDLARRRYHVLDRMTPPDIGPLPPFHADKASQFGRVLASASEVERAYFQECVSFVAREERVARIGFDADEERDGFAALWRLDLDEKIRRFRVLPRLELSNIDPATSEMSFARSQSDPLVSVFRPGDIAVLYPLEPDGRAEPQRHPVFKCTIRDIADDTVRVVLRNHKQDLSIFKGQTRWALEPDFIDSGYRSMYQSLFQFLTAEQSRRDLLLGLREPQFTSEPIVQTSLDGSQRELLLRALSAQDYFLLQGPPGTGKTRVILRELVSQLHSNPREQVLLLAFTNRAVDEICSALETIEPALSFIRLGSETNTRYGSHLLSQVCQGKSPEDVKQAIQETRVFVSTVATLQGSADLLSLKQFTVAVVDEASQLLEPHLVGVLSTVKRFILIGDENQLPAVVIQPEEVSRTVDPLFREIGLTDLRESIFERLLKRCRDRGWHKAYGSLNQQARMHVEIAAFSNETYYAGRLKPMYDRQWAPITRFSPSSPDPWESNLARSRLLFIPTKPETRQRVNKQEAQLVCDILVTIARAYGADLSAESVGVIAPFRAQIAEIRHQLVRRQAESPALRELIQHIAVDTVERYQGSERDVIVLSLATNHHAQLRGVQALNADGSVDRKLNVALTRAREHVIILGCPTILEAAPHFRALLDHIANHGMRILMP